MNTEDFSQVVNETLEDIEGSLKDGFSEYARDKDNVFANFDRIAERVSSMSKDLDKNRCNLNREDILLVYLEKHLDGILSWVNGHHSQRESVEGRIVDAISYLVLLRAMARSRVDS